MRVTVDLDWCSQLQLFKTYFNMRHIVGVDELRLSSSGHGYHLIKRGLPITYEQSLEIRAMLSECGTRLKFDGEKNAKPKQILFTVKLTSPSDRLPTIEEILEIQRQRVIPESKLLALPWFSRVPRSYFVEKERKRQRRLKNA